jgi:hypothetical protein
MSKISHRLTTAFAAVLASTITLGATLAPFARAGDAEQNRRHLPGGAGVAERYRATQPTANDLLLAPRGGVTDLRAVPHPAATI